ncbi:MAG: hypothetical protein ACYCS8_00045 [Acidithiobacillus sp.]
MMVALSRKNIVIGLLAVGIIGSVAYAGSQYALYSHEMKVFAHEHVGTVFIRGKIHGQPFQWITNVEVSTALPGVSMVLGSPYSYTLRFQGMKGNKAKVRFVVWQRRSLVANQSGKGNKSSTLHGSRPMDWEAVIPSMTEKLATKGSPEPIYSPMSGMHYLPNTPVSAADGKASGNAGTQNELQAAWIGAPEALGDVH